MKRKLRELNNFEHIIYQSDIFDGLNELPDNSIDIAVTSPPYWGQRDYEFDGQIGNEGDYKDYISKLLFLFDILKEKLKPKGVFFLNIGDKYLNKYGNTPLGMIPYQLAYLMKKNGWFVEEILIWYKPNHMPSSIRNRFSNTYEPVFAFTKSPDNYFSEAQEKNNYSNLLKIKTQPTKYKHVAVFPEKLIETLLVRYAPKQAVILDPFSGSGTTCKASQNLNNSIEGFEFKSVMIEANDSYVNINLERCGLSKANVFKLEKSSYRVTSVNLDYSFNPNKRKVVNNEPENGIVKIFNNKERYLDFIQSLKDIPSENLRPTSLFYLGIKDFDIDTIFETSKLNYNGWIIRNQLIIRKGNKWFPIYFVVKDTKLFKYHFNIDDIRKNHKNGNSENYYLKNFYQLKVMDNLSKNTDKKGKIVKIQERKKNGYPKFVYVEWNDGIITQEHVTYEEENSEYIKFLCPNCGKVISNNENILKKKCSECKTDLWSNLKTIPILIEDLPFETSERIEYFYKNKEEFTLFTKNYKGKFLDTKDINKGASPGARSSTQTEYLAVDRFYKINQPMIADYLNIKRISKNLFKKDLTNLFPSDYKHTVGHWLRKDMGGSVPRNEDWKKLVEILDLDDFYTKYVCRKTLKLQTVKTSSNGKNPGDYLEESESNIRKMLFKTFN